MEPLYHQDAYCKTFNATIVSALEEGIVLDKTAFYPGGGGQPCDQGLIRIGGLDLPIRKVRRKEGEIWHQIDGELPEVGAIVEGEIDWQRRYALMRLSSSVARCRRCTSRWVCCAWTR